MEQTETALIQQLYQLKARVNEVLGTKARVELNILDVPTDKLRLIASLSPAANIRVTNDSHHIIIQSIAGRINITDDSMPF